MKQLLRPKYWLPVAVTAALSGCWMTQSDAPDPGADTDDPDVPDASSPFTEPLEWIGLPGGRFDMGSTDFGDEGPVHEVNVPPFSMLKTEVTAGQYRLCESEGACTAPLNCGRHTTYQKNDNLPINCITVHQAREFCTYAGGRLPSEAEWEYAAKSGGQPRRFPWGDQEADCTRAVMSAGIEDEAQWGCGEGSVLTVCSKPNGNTDQGICDLAGNLWEWVQDGYYDGYTDAPEDGSARPADNAAGAVVRGGCFYDDSVALRTTERARSLDQGADIGFRCVKN